jgi:hypothetical protein
MTLLKPICIYTHTHITVIDEETLFMNMVYIYTILLDGLTYNIDQCMEIYSNSMWPAGMYLKLATHFLKSGRLIDQKIDNLLVSKMVYQPGRNFL